MPPLGIGPRSIAFCPLCLFSLGNLHFLFSQRKERASRKLSYYPLYYEGTRLILLKKYFKWFRTFQKAIFFYLLKSHPIWIPFCPTLFRVPFEVFCDNSIGAPIVPIIPPTQSAPFIEPVKEESVILTELLA